MKNNLYINCIRPCTSFAVFYAKEKIILGRKNIMDVETLRHHCFIRSLFKNAPKNVKSKFKTPINVFFLTTPTNSLTLRNVHFLGNLKHSTLRNVTLAYHFRYVSEDVR